MAKDVNIHVKTQGTDQAKRQLDEVGRSAKDVGDGARKGAKGVDELGTSASKSRGIFGKFVSDAASWMTKFAGFMTIVMGFTKAVQAQSKAIEEHGNIAAAQQQKLLALMGMGTFYETHPEARKQVAAFAEYGKRPFEEVATAWYGLESKGAGLTESQKQNIMKEALELGRMEPEAGLTNIIDVLALYAKETRQKDANQIQNVIRQTLSQAGADVTQIGQYLPQFLSLGIAGGLTGAETAGLWAFATTRAPSPEKATVGIRNIFMALQGKGKPESQKLLQSLGISPDMTVFEQLTALSAARGAGRFGVPEAELLAGTENAAILMSMLTEPAAMMEIVRQVTAVDRPDIDITRQKLDRIMGTDKIARLEENLREQRIRVQNIKGRDVRALEWQALLAEYEAEMREAGVPEYIILLQLWKYRQAAAFGAEPGPQWLMEPFGEFTEFPSPVGAGASPVIINDSSMNYYPRTGPDERGPRFTQD